MPGSPILVNHRARTRAAPRKTRKPASLQGHIGKLIHQLQRLETDTHTAVIDQIRWRIERLEDEFPTYPLELFAPTGVPTC
ncbi:hypothetical protein ABZW96_33125 [Nocardia sp. NPDC004168]|uniref:hypothetical protein n=1 Tax=Nocardia sp. NPDC004168 TaxID=3154452 RepID=UPI00339F3704